MKGERWLNNDSFLKEIRSAPLIIQAVVLRFLVHVPSAESLCRALARRLLHRAVHKVTHGDLQEAFIVLDALAAYDATLLSGKLWAQAIKRLVNSERAVGGPYAEQDGQLSLVTNGAINSLLKRAGSPLPRVEAFLKYIEEQSRTIEMVAVRALALGRWRKGDIFAWPVTAAALRLAVQSGGKPNEATRRHEALLVFRGARRTLQKLEEPLRIQGMTMIDELKAFDNNDEIALLSYFFQQSIVSKTKLSPQLWRQLGVANLLYWLAYITYDNLLDDEGEPERLSIANVAMRQSVELYQHAVPLKNDYNWITSVFNAMDAANAWELHHARADIYDGYLHISELPTFKKRQHLAGRAYGHVLGPLIIARYAGIFTLNEQRRIERAWQHFLIAKQLSDDMHDWIDDLYRGRISFIIADMLRVLRIQPDNYELSTLKKHLQLYFWQSGLERYARLIKSHSNKAEQLFSSIPQLILQDGLRTIVVAHKQAADAALVRHRREKQFLQNVSLISG